MKKQVKKVITLSEIAKGCKVIARKLDFEEFEPDVIVAIAKGGLIPAYFLAKKYGCPIITTNVRSYDGTKQGELEDWDVRNIAAEIDAAQYDNVLIVDDLVDSGRTLEYVENNFLTGIVNSTLQIRTATLYKKKGSKITPDVYFQEVGNDWLEFEYEVL